MTLARKMCAFCTVAASTAPVSGGVIMPCRRSSTCWAAAALGLAATWATPRPVALARNAETGGGDAAGLGGIAATDRGGGGGGGGGGVWTGAVPRVTTGNGPGGGFERGTGAAVVGVPADPLQMRRVTPYMKESSLGFTQSPLTSLALAGPLRSVWA